MSQTPSTTSVPGVPTAEKVPHAENKDTSSLKRQALRASFWAVTGMGSGQAIRLAGNIVLTRLLFPEAFGVMALVNIFRQGLQLFSDVGIAPSIIQNKRGDDTDFLNSAWTIQIIRGILLWLCSCLIALPIASFYDQPILTLLIPVSGVNAIIAGFFSTKLATSNRHLKLGLVTIINLGSSAFGVACMIIWAYWSPSIWALVGGGLMHTTMKLVLSHLILPGKRNRFRWDPESVSELFRFGRMIFLSTMALYVASQGERLILGKIIDIRLLGIYSIALMISRLPVLIAASVIRSVGLPSIAKLHVRDPDRLTKQYKRLRIVMSIVGLAMVTILAGFGPTFIDLLYDNRYHEATWMIKILSAVSAFEIHRQLGANLLIGTGSPGYVATANVTRAVILISGLAIAVSLGGLVAGLVLLSLSSFAGMAVTAYGVAKSFPPLRQVEFGNSLISGAGILTIIILLI